MRSNARKWLAQAEAELRSAKNAVRYKDYYVASFLAHQSVEKALKAVLLSRGEELIKIHNLVILGKRVGLSSDLVGKCDRLNAVYIETRYPDISQKIPSKKFTLRMSQEDVDAAKEVVLWSKKKILR